MAENPVSIFRQDCEFGAILERLVEGRFVVFADSLAGDCFPRDNGVVRTVNVSPGQPGVDAQDGRDENQDCADPVTAPLTEEQGSSCDEGGQQETGEGGERFIRKGEPVAPEQDVRPPGRWGFAK